MIEFTPEPSEVGERVDVVVARRSGETRALVQEALRTGAVTVDAAIVKAGHRLKGNEQVRGVVAPATAAPPSAEDVPVAVRYADDRVLVVSKPAGVVTHPATGHRAGTLVNALLALGEPLAAAGTTRPGIVHRLDKDTSGLLLVAKDDAALESLGAALAARRVRRSYLALVRGAPSMPSGTIDAPVGRHPARPRLRAVLPGGKPAVTHFTTLGAAPGMALLDVRLETGRTHQIRVHLAHLGHPVLGDRPYGGATEAAAALGLERSFLHAYRLEWPHPDDGRTVTVVDELPADLVAALRRAGIEVPAL
ncbi:MAG: RluA family pseudouridine synthase [Actinomycetota bacterium]